MDDQQGTKRQDDEQREGGERTASKGINPVQHSERGADPAQAASKGINPVQHSEGRQADEGPGSSGGRGGSAEGNEKGNG